MKRKFTSFLLAMATMMPTMAANNITPGQTWNDTKGSAINAHGGCVVYSEGYYYWFGENRSGGKSAGVSCYRSSDLYNWERLALAVTPTGTMTDECRDIAMVELLNVLRLFTMIRQENGSCGYIGRTGLTMDKPSRLYV